MNNKKVTSKDKKIAAVIGAVQNLDTSTIVKEVGELQVSLQNKLAGVTASIVEKIDKLHQVDEAISVKEERLKELFEIDQEGLNLETVKAIRATEEKNFADLKADTLKAWELEKKNHTLEKTREQEEYNYKTKIERQRILDEFDSLVAKKKKDEEIRTIELQREWSEFDEALQVRENNLKGLEEQVATFPETLKHEIAKAEAIVRSQLKREFDVEKKMLEKDVESEKKLNDAKIIDLNNQITNLANQLKDTQKLLEAARLDARDVTAKALESQSGQAALTALQKMMESNNTPNKK